MGMGRLNALGSREVADKYPWERVLSGKGEGVVLVDVGGGKGQLLKEIIQVHGGSIRGGVVLQDLKHVLGSETIVGEEDGVELMPYNFLEEVQPVKGGLIMLKVSFGLISFLRRKSVLPQIDPARLA